MTNVCANSRHFFRPLGDERVVWIVNPLKYALEYFVKYIDLIQEETKILFVGMNSARRPPTGVSGPIVLVLFSIRYEQSHMEMKRDKNMTVPLAHHLASYMSL